MFLIPHVGTIFWLIIIFGAVWFVLAKFAWKPLLKALDERQSSVENALSAANEARKSLALIKYEQNQLIEQARLEKERIVKEAFAQRDKIIADAKNKAILSYETMVLNARKHIEQEKKGAVDDIKSQIAVMSVEIASQLMKGDMSDRKRHEELVKGLVNQINVH